MNLNKYFDAPIFDSPKSTYIVRWQNEFERRLITYFDSDPRIKDFFQLLMSVVAKYDDEYSIDIDFWLEYASGEVNLIHIEQEQEELWEMKRQILANAKQWLKLDGFCFVTISDGKLKSVSAKTFNFESASLAIDANFENFKWTN
jgi:hypothetical protein